MNKIQGFRDLLIVDNFLFADMDITLYCMLGSGGSGGSLSLDFLDGTLRG